MRQAAVPLIAIHPHRLAAGEPGEDGGATGAPSGRLPSEHSLPYTIELWDETKSYVEQVLAVTAHGSIGFAAYYAATREYPDRYVTLRHKGGVVSRWNSPGH